MKVTVMHTRLPWTCSGQPSMHNCYFRKQLAIIMIMITETQLQTDMFRNKKDLQITQKS